MTLEQAVSRVQRDKRVFGYVQDSRTETLRVYVPSSDVATKVQLDMGWLDACVYHDDYDTELYVILVDYCALLEESEE